LNKDQQRPTDEPACTTPAMKRLIATLAPIWQDNPVSMCVTNRQAQLLYANQAFLDMLESSPELATIRGHALHRLFSRHSRRVIDYLEALIDDQRSVTLQKNLHLGNEHNPAAMQIHAQS
jgi:PAS domain-containing protein